MEREIEGGGDGEMGRRRDGAMGDEKREKRKSAVIRSFRVIRVPISNHFAKISTFAP